MAPSPSVQRLDVRTGSTKANYKNRSSQRELRPSSQEIRVLLFGLLSSTIACPSRIAEWLGAATLAHILTITPCAAACSSVANLLPCKPQANKQASRQETIVGRPTLVASLPDHDRQPECKSWQHAAGRVHSSLRTFNSQEPAKPPNVCQRSPCRFGRWCR